MTTFGLTVVEEAVGGSCDRLDLAGYLHLLAADLHTPQRDDGYRSAPLSAAHPCSYERWFRVRFEPPFTYVYGLRFWAPNLILPPGWQISWGTSDGYQQPTQAPSSVAVQDVPTGEPDAVNFAVRPLPGEDGIAYSPWAVLQARLVGDVAAGPAIVEHGPELDVPVLIVYHLDWSQG